MAHESFEDEATARLMNGLFVNVKVDREERPDVDAVYMEATQAMTGQGGWPMTVLMTPDGHPFYCGTYFPRPQFQALLQAVHKAWNEQRADVIEQGQQVVRALTARGPLAAGGAEPPGTERLDGAVRALARSYDAARGGFGGAPKFPPSMALEFLLRHHARTGDAESLAMAGHTLEAMARGGMYDQLGGGFARYSVDDAWIVPHFEKMLYDNALLARVYAHWWRATGNPFARRIALETCDWMLRDLRTEEGGLASALDADSEGVEGRFYVWTPEQLVEVLGEEDGAYAAELFGVTPEQLVEVLGEDSEGVEGRFYVWTPEQLVEVLGEEDGAYAAELFGVTPGGTFEHGSSVLRLLTDPEDLERYDRVRSALLEARGRRVPPARDDKVVAAWNGLAVAALAECGALLERPDLVTAAVDVAALITRLHVRDGRLVRTSRDGAAGSNAGVLEDYADVAEGLIALHGVTGEPEYVRLAGELLDTVLDRFADGSGGFYDTADDAEALFRRPQDPTDNATPSGQFAAAGALLSYAALTGGDRYREAAAGALAPAGLLAAEHARFAGWGLAVAEAFAAGPLEVAVVGPRGDELTRALHRTALMAVAPGAVVSLGEPGSAGVPLLEGRGLVDGSPAAYVCRGFTCRLPVTTTRDLARELRD